jgi:hypothetical protein
MTTTAIVCPNCGESNPPRTRTCWVCSLALPAPAGGPQFTEGQKTLHKVLKVIAILSIAWAALSVLFVVGFAILIYVTCFASGGH